MKWLICFVQRDSLRFNYRFLLPTFTDIQGFESAQNLDRSFFQLLSQDKNK